MKQYNVTIEDGIELTTRVVEEQAKNAQEAHKKVLFQLKSIEEITLIKDADGCVVFRRGKGFY